MNKPAAIAYWRKRFDQMEAEGFELVKRIPSFEASRFPIVFGSYSPEQRTQLKELLAARAVASFDHADPSHSGPIDKRLHDLILRLVDRSLYPEFTKSRCRAPELRKVAKIAFEQLLGAKPAKALNPGDWRYAGQVLDQPITVEIRYGVSWSPLMYTVRVDPSDFLAHNFESMYGIGIGNWDLIFPDNIDQAFATLKEIVTAYVQDHVTMQQLLNGGKAP